ncbi:MAG: hypothetical protein ACXWMX_02855 [Candidatus Limnocylindrales bacterium]
MSPPAAIRDTALRVALPLLLVAVAITACMGPGASSGPTFAIGGVVTRGPICPVERVPPDPACAPRPVANAVLSITDAAGGEVARATSGADGRWAAAVPAGSYRLVPQPVGGLMGTPQPIPFEVVAGGVAPKLDVEYDTGIR